MPRVGWSVADCREASVQSLKQLLEKAYRKVAFKLVNAGLIAPGTTYNMFSSSLQQVTNY